MPQGASGRGCISFPTICSSTFQRTADHSPGKSGTSNRYPSHYTILWFCHYFHIALECALLCGDIQTHPGKIIGCSRVTAALFENSGLKKLYQSFLSPLVWLNFFWLVLKFGTLISILRCTNIKLKPGLEDWRGQKRLAHNFFSNLAYLNSWFEIKERISDSVFECASREWVRYRQQIYCRIWSGFEKEEKIENDDSFLCDKQV